MSRCLDCLLNRLFRRISKKISKLRVTGLCEGNSPMTSEFPAQRASITETVFIWWRHHGATARRYSCFFLWLRELTRLILRTAVIQNGLFMLQSPCDVLQVNWAAAQLWSPALCTAWSRARFCPPMHYTAVVAGAKCVYYNSIISEGHG